MLPSLYPNLIIHEYMRDISNPSMWLHFDILLETMLFVSHGKRTVH